MAADMTHSDPQDSRRDLLFLPLPFVSLLSFLLTGNIEYSTPVRKGTAATSRWTIAALFFIQGHQAVLGSLLSEPELLL